LSFSSFAQNKNFISEAHQFSVAFPSQVIQETQQVNKNTGTIKVTVYMSESDGQLFMVSHGAYPQKMVDFTNKDAVMELLEDNLIGTFNKLVKGTGQKPEISAQEYFKYNNSYHAMRSIGTAGQYQVQTFIFFLNNEMYQVMVLGLGKTIAPESAMRFFKSFKLQSL
jgi:hypothetical protein